MNFLKGIKLDFICMKIKLMQNKKYSQQNISRMVLVPQITTDFTSRVSKSYVPFTCKFPMVIHFVPILPRCCRSKTNCYCFSYDKTSLKFCVSFRFFLAVFKEKIKKIRYLNYVRRGIVVARNTTLEEVSYIKQMSILCLRILFTFVFMEIGY